MNAQLRRYRSRKSSLYQQEIGANIGITNSQGDFVSDGAADGSIKVNGFSINATHSIHMLPRRYKGGSIFKKLVLKSNFGYTYASFNNRGLASGNEPLFELVGGVRDYSRTPNSTLLGRLTSKTSIISFGTQLEYYFKDVRKYIRKYSRSGDNTKFNPYVAIGLGLNYVSNTVSYDNEAIINNAGGFNGLPDNYTFEILEDVNELVFSGSIAIGTRYKLNHLYDLVGELKVKSYFSDTVDGVDPDVSGNSFNDYSATISLGVIYHLF